MPALKDLLAASPYLDYVYSYPHKSAYRALEHPRRLREAWAGEDRSALFLYVHVPFCEMRCGFCNLFTSVRPGGEFVESYLGALERQARIVREELGEGASFARLAFGGGTPSLLEPPDLERLFEVAQGVMGAPKGLPASFEVSPATVTAEKLDILKERGASRVSIGVQSFFQEETSALSRPQPPEELRRALGLIRGRDFPTLNIDLIYGIPGQTTGTFLASLEAALEWTPQELYLYPLYSRPLTLMGRRRDEIERDDQRIAIYRAGRDFLLERGWRQASMRMFSAPGAPSAEDNAPAYRCQADGMVGLGCGARSYTEGLHYSTRYAVKPRNIRGIIEDYCASADEDFRFARHGFELDAEDRRRRTLILSLLSSEGVDLADRGGLFGAPPGELFPELAELEAEGVAERSEGGRLSLTPRGVEVSDAIGHWLFSERVRDLMASSEAA